MQQKGSSNSKGTSKVTSHRGPWAPQKATSSQVETCDVCCLPIVDDKEDALLCEGACQK